MSEPDILRRRIVQSMISNICLNCGFLKAEAYALETLSEMFINCMLVVFLYFIFKQFYYINFDFILKSFPNCPCKQSYSLNYKDAMKPIFTMWDLLL